MKPTSNEDNTSDKRDLNDWLSATNRPVAARTSRRGAAAGWQHLEREAEQSGRSISAIIRDLVSEKVRKAPARSSLYERTRDLCGRVRSGCPDLATNPAHLNEFGT